MMITIDSGEWSIMPFRQGTPTRHAKGPSLADGKSDGAAARTQNHAGPIVDDAGYRASSRLGGLADTLVLVFGIATFVCLSVASLLFTVHFPTYTEGGATYRHGTIPVVVCGSIVVMVAVVLLHVTGILKRLNAGHVAWYVAAYLAIAGMGWAILANTWPDRDALDLMVSAHELGTQDDPLWSHGAYMERFPYQIPFVLFLRVLQTVFGTNAYLAVEMVNALCSASAGYLLIRYALEVFGNEAANLTAMLSVCFLPSVLYTTFAYGNIPCMPFAIGALLVQYRYFQNRRLRTALLSAVLVAISILLKSTMIVILIAMCLAWLITGIVKRQWRDMVAIVSSLLVYVVCTSGINAAVAHRYHVVTDNGLPKIAWIAMGMHTADYPRISDIPGRYDGFVWSWQGDDYNTETATADSKAALRQTWDHFTADPGYAARFMGRKLLFIWTDPLYESILESNWSTEGPRKPGAMASRPMTGVLRSVYYGRLNATILAVADIVQFLTFLGTVLALIARRKQLHVEQMVPLIACLGMVLIYIFWEAKPQYALPVGWLMPLYAGCGLFIAARLCGQLCGRWLGSHHGHTAVSRSSESQK